MSRSMKWFLLGVWMGAVSLVGVACHSGVPSRSSRVEEKMLSMLSMAKSRHRLATLALRAGKSDNALGYVDKILSLKFPKGFRPGEEMLLDAWARKAKMQLRLKQAKAALVTINAAIARPTWLVNSFYLANLYQVRGQVLEALQKPKRAVKSYQRSIKLNQRVIREIERKEGGPKR